MNIFDLQNFFHFQLGRIYTLLGRRSFAAFGQRSHLFYPCRIHHPDRIHIGSDTIIFKDTWINPVTQWCNQKYEPKILIGDNCLIMNNVQISAASEIRIGNNTSIGRNSVITDHVHDYRDVNHTIMYAPLGNIKPVSIGDESMLMVNCIIAPGASIGKHCFIGANSLVRTAIPDYSMAVGSPAKVIMSFNQSTGLWEKCGTRNEKSAGMQ